MEVLSLFLAETAEFPLVGHQDDVFAHVGQFLILATKHIWCQPVHQWLSDVPVASLHQVVFRAVHHHYGDTVAFAVGIGYEHLLHSQTELDVQLVHVLDALIGRSLVIVVERLHDVQETAPRVGVYRDEGETGLKAVVDGHGVVAAQLLLGGIDG